MVGRLASDALGTSHKGDVVSPQDFGQTVSDNYVLHEAGEKIHFLIRSKSDEHCFTNLGLIHVDGSGAASKKVQIYRLTYKLNPVSDVRLETAGWIDSDIEIEFKMGDRDFDLEVKKDYLKQARDLYKSLTRIGEIQYKNEELFKYASGGLSTASDALKNIEKADIDAADQFQRITQYAYSWMADTQAQLERQDFGEVFETFVKN